jgi:hypothetical protein
MLLAALESGDMEATYQVALVLAGSPEHREAAVSLLMRPAGARHLAALELLEASHERFAETVGDHACALGRTAAERGLREAALLFFQTAAQCGSLDGLVELAVGLLTERGDRGVAERIKNVYAWWAGADSLRPNGSSSAG